MTKGILFKEEDKRISTDDTEQPNRKEFTIYERIKRAVRKIRKSNLLSESLRHFCETTNVEPRRLIIDMPVRWNSTCKMLKRCLALRLVSFNGLTAVFNI
ncbi:unnamed protein product [Allacma fusca]|uniref:Uncharacterized protein n=1 Tax=Allacma fusca TaxID=39272 RepID=A0A8J2L8J8_9HEXA|nr:unnamed protein product [Allacma fusca]